MSFQQFLNALWRYRVVITASAAVFCALVFGLLFAFHQAFQIAVVNLAITIATAVFYVLGIALILSIMWKQLMGNIFGGGKKKK